MADAQELFSGISGGRVLDVGTGRGGFVEDLVAELEDYDEIIGVDIDGDLAADFENRFAEHPRVRFLEVDAEALPFEDGTFDTVSIAASLHHLGDPQRGLREMMRVLKPGGHLIVVEMYRDGQTNTQETHVRLHHWWAAIDRLGGTVHRETYTRREVVDFVNGLGLTDLAVRDETYFHENPMDPKQLAQLQSSIDTYLQRTSGHADLRDEGVALRERLRTVGFHGATVLVAMGTKP